MDLEALKNSLLSKFQEETADRLQKIQLGLLELEKPDGSKAADEVARELHTMKGEARILGLAAIGQVAHAAEDLLRAAREGKTATATATDLLLKACDGVTALLQDPGGAKSGTSASAELCKRLAELSGREVPPLKVKQAPSGNLDGPGPPRPLGNDRAIRVNVEALDRMGAVAGDLVVESARARLRFGAVQGVLERFSQLSDRFVRAGRGEDPEALERELHRLRDDSFRLVRQHLDGLDVLHGTLEQLADDVDEARLVPLSTVFDSLPRAVREMAHEQGKQIQLSIQNPNVGVDRSMLANVRDALVHLLRNAVDHGVEPPEAREAAQKPPSATIEVRVRADGDLLHLEVEDDGRGIDPERVKASALKKRLIPADRAAAMTPREAIELVFVPGFSTREEVTELSGRGVGLDVVKRKVEAIGGSVALRSEVGKGTVATLRLPQSLSLVRVLLVRLGGDVYGIPATDVEAVLRVRREDRVEILGLPAVRHRDRPVALVALGPMLGLDSGPAQERPPAVIVHHGADCAALTVDSFVDEREVAVKPCGGELLHGAPFIAGTAALEDGRVAVLLHVPDVMAEVRRSTRPASTTKAARRLRVLLIDDSPIARATEAALVKALGHSVEEAQDGEEGLARIQAGSFDLILTDVQMPRMDGFTLTRRLKGAPEHSKLPVIILSSLASPEDKRRGAEAGADAYLVKAELAVETLAQAIERLT